MFVNNNSLNGINVYVGNDEKLHFVDSAGADTALPFSNASKKEIESQLEQLTSNTGTHSTANATSEAASYTRAYNAFNMLQSSWEAIVSSASSGASVAYLDDNQFDCNVIYLLIVRPSYNSDYYALREHTGIVEYTIDGTNWIVASERVYTTSEMTVPHFFTIKDRKIRGIRYRTEMPNSSSRDGYAVQCSSLIALA